MQHNVIFWNTLSDQRVVGPASCRTNELSDQRFLSDHQIVGPSMCRTRGTNVDSEKYCVGLTKCRSTDARPVRNVFVICSGETKCTVAAKSSRGQVSAMVIKSNYEETMWLYRKIHSVYQIIRFVDYINLMKIYGMAPLSKSMHKIHRHFIGSAKL